VTRFDEAALIDALHETLGRRARPEDVAAMLVEPAHREFLVKDRLARIEAIDRERAGDAINHERAGQRAGFAHAVDLEHPAMAGLGRRAVTDLVGLAARRAYWAGYSSMSGDFERPVPADRLMVTCAELLGGWVGDPADPGAVRENADRLGARLGARAGDDYAARLPRRICVERGEMSRRQFNKLWRLWMRLDAKAAAMERGAERRHHAMLAKSGLLHEVERDEVRDLATARFLAYFAARANRRSTFTWGRQERPFDRVCESMLAALPDPAASAPLVALAWPASPVLNTMTERQRGELLGRWAGELDRLAARLGVEWGRARGGRGFDPAMVVGRGDDSDTWNHLAGAWNHARKQWLALVWALGLGAVLDHRCPGKALRLMAADVVWMHREWGSGDLEPDTVVWARLPKPWEAWAGSAHCGAGFIRRVCEDAGIDPDASGWTSPRPAGAPAPATPTPELVHGVAVGSPVLADALRRIGAFSGPSKGLKVPS
jgi:hypothetical protein